MDRYCTECGTKYEGIKGGTDLCPACETKRSAQPPKDKQPEKKS